MLGIALLGFREVLEAALIITIVCAATRGVPGRGWFVSGGLALGVLAGLTEAIPYIGPWLSGVVSVVVALVTVDPLKALEVLILFIIVQQVEGNLVQPLVMSRSVHLDPLLVLIAILVGSELLGLMGAILAVPFAALVQSLVTYALAPAIRHASGVSGAPSAPPAPPAPQSVGGEAPTEASTPI